MLSCTFQPALAADDSVTKTAWQITKENVERFFDMDKEAILCLYEHDENYRWPSFGNILLDRNVTLHVNGARKLSDFSFSTPAKVDLKGGPGPNDDWLGSGIDKQTVWTGVARKKSSVYWSIIKANVDKFIGMNSAQIISLLGPERCAAKGVFIDYRIGNTRLRFCLKDDKVISFTFEADRYDKAT